jgi:hypothetical protein
MQDGDTVPHFWQYDTANEQYDAGALAPSATDWQRWYGRGLAG